MTTERPRTTTASRAAAASRVRYALVPLPTLGIEGVARRSGLHPDLLRRFVALGLVDAGRGPSGELLFPLSAPAQAARVQRLRCGLNLNYAAVGLVVDLLDRINRLEAALRSTGTRSDHRPWT
jgi:chaperone modulatory protein CbpM